MPQSSPKALCPSFAREALQISAAIARHVHGDITLCCLLLITI
jgi:hypothetical protein